MRLTFIKDFFKIVGYSCQIAYELVRSVVTIYKLQIPFVTILGGSKESVKGLYYRQAYELSRKFVENDVSVLTGGGPGIMEAASNGAASAQEDIHNYKRHTMGVTVAGVDQWFDSECCFDSLKVNHFFVRKWVLSRYSVGFVFFPGGIGTLDELFDVLNLIKHYRIPEFPIVLIGKDYWSPIVNMLNQSCLKQGFIDERLANLFIVTDSVDDAFEIVYESCKLFKNVE